MAQRPLQQLERCPVRQEHGDAEEQRRQGRMKIPLDAEEWHRILKSGCHVEAREFKTAQTLERALAFDFIVAWRVLAMVKLGRVVPQLPADILYTPAEQKVLTGHLKFKKNEKLDRF